MSEYTCLSIRPEVLERLRNLKKRLGFRSYSDLLLHLMNLQEAIEASARGIREEEEEEEDENLV